MVTCKLGELFGEGSRLGYIALVISLLDTNGGRMKRFSLREILLEKSSDYNPFLTRAKLSGTIGSEYTARAYIDNAATLGLIKKFGRLAHGPDVLISSRAQVFALLERIYPRKHLSLVDAQKIFFLKLLIDLDFSCWSELLSKFAISNAMSLSELYEKYFSDMRKKQFQHIYKVHLEWGRDLALFDKIDGEYSLTEKGYHLEQTWKKSDEGIGIDSSTFLLYDPSLKTLRDKKAIQDYLKLAYVWLEKNYPYAGEYVAVHALCDLSQLLATFVGQCVAREVIENELSDIWDAHRNSVLVMAPTSIEKDIGNPLTFGEKLVAYTRFLDKSLLLLNYTIDDLLIDSIKPFFRG